MSGVKQPDRQLWTARSIFIVSVGFKAEPKQFAEELGRHFSLCRNHLLESVTNRSPDYVEHEKVKTRRRHFGAHPTTDDVTPPNLLSVFC
jgi:hypothetical protein